MPRRNKHGGPIADLTTGPPPMNWQAAIDKAYGPEGKALKLDPVDRINIAWMVEKSWLYQLEYGRGPTRDELKKVGNPDSNYIGDHRVDKYYDENYFLAAYYRGIRWARNGIDERQSLLLSVLTDLTDTRTQAQILRALGIRPSEFQAWLELPEFKKQFHDFTERANGHVKLAVDNALNSMAASGNLAAMKYWDVRSGTFDPDRQKNVDVMAVLQGTVEILQDLIKDPLLLQEIARRMQLMATGQMAGTGLNLGGSYGSSDNTTRVIEASRERTD